MKPAHVLAFLSTLVIAALLHAQHSDWSRRAWTFESEHYAVKTDLKRETAHELARHMDVMHEHYSRIMANMRPRSRHRLNLYLFNHPDDYLATLEREFDEDGQGTAGVCVRDGSTVTLAAWKGPRSTDVLKRTLQHEGFHQFARLLFPSIAPWADEGVAELCESAFVLGGQVIFGDVEPARLALLQNALKSNALIPLDDLFRIDGEDWLDHVNEGRGALQYAQAWAIVHFLVFGENQRHQASFNRFLNLMNRGQSWQSAFNQAFGTNDFQSLQRAVAGHIAALRATDLRETARRLDFLAAGLLALHAKDIHVSTLDELRGQLREIGFVHRSTLFGEPAAMKASEEQVFIVPGAPPPPDSDELVFELVKQEERKRGSPSRGRERRPARERQAKPDADASATPESPRSQPGPGADPGADSGAGGLPMAVVTRNLRPLNMGVMWSRNPRSGELSYTIVVD